MMCREQAEWEKVFNPEIYTGDLNIPDFNMMDFTGTAGSTTTPSDPNNPSNPYPSTLDPTTFHTQAAANISNIGITTSNPLNVPIGGGGSTGAGGAAEDLSDVQFTPTWFPSGPRPVQGTYGAGGQSGQGGGAYAGGWGGGQGQGQRYGSG